MPRPFGTWHPATTIAELRARTPAWRDFRFVPLWRLHQETYYHPETMAMFKNPQAFRDHVDTVKNMKYSKKFLGDGVKFHRHMWMNCLLVMMVQTVVNMGLIWYYYNRWVPATSPTWRKFMNKEWEEAINNSPWDHRSHVWQYTKISAAHVGCLTSAGSKKFYIPS